MLHTIFNFFQQYRFWIYMLIALIGFVIYCVAEHLRKKARENPYSVAVEKTIALYIASLLLMIGVVVAFALDGYYDRFLGWFIG